MPHEDEIQDANESAAPKKEREDVYADLEHPLRPIVKKWLKLIDKARKHKQDQFMDDAMEAMRFFNGPYDFLYERDYRKDNGTFAPGGDVDIGEPSFRMTANVVSEMTQIFGPILYFKNPDRLASPRKLPEPPMGVLSSLMGNGGMGGDPNDPNAPPDPMMQQQQQLEQALMQQMQAQQTKDETRAKFMEWILNYTPTELGLKQHSRICIDETIIKGASIMVTEVYQPKGGNNRLIGSFWTSVDKLFLDPDAERRDEIQWSAIECTHPVWQVEREYGFEPGTLKPNSESFEKQADNDTDKDGGHKRATGQSNDLLTYYKVYSRQGIGGRLKNAPEELRESLEAYGDYCYLVIAKDHPFPLNVPPELLAMPLDQPMPGAPDAGYQGGAEMQQPAVKTVQDVLFDRLQWPTPFWLDDEWPWTFFSFHDVPGQLWPHSHLYPALGYVKFLNWAYSFIASKIRITCRDFIAIKSSVEQELKEAILNGKDLTLLKIAEAHQEPISNIVTFLQHPEMNKDLFSILDMVQHQFEKATGLSELLYGFSEHQFRSAEEAHIKGEHLQIRPDDMLDKMEEGQTLLARKEAFAWRWHADAQRDIAPLMGPAGAYYWEQLVGTSDPYEMATQINYRIEAGSTRKPNRERQAANMQTAMQTMFQPFFEIAMQGNVAPYNALVSDWGAANGQDVSDYMLSPPPPPQGPSPEEQQLQIEQQKAEADIQVKQAGLQIDQQKAAMDLEQSQAESQQQMIAAMQQMQMDAAEHRQKMAQNEQKFQQALEQMKAKAAQGPDKKKAA